MKGERPEYVPWLLTRGRLSRLYWASPARAFAWLVVTPFGVGIVAVLNLLVGSTIVGVVFIVGTALTLAQAVYYGPRALKALRGQRRTGAEQ
jgi:hypothetical protein